MISKRRTLGCVATIGAMAVGVGASAPAASANVVGLGGGGVAGDGVAWTAPDVAATNQVFKFTGAPPNSGTVTMTCTSNLLESIGGAGNRTASFAPAYGNCSVNLAGIPCRIDITTPGRWSLTQGLPGIGTPKVWGMATAFSAGFKIEYNDLGCGLGPADCTIDVPAQGGLSGAKAKNANANQVNLSGTVSGIAWTSTTPNCQLGTGGSTATYSINGTTGTNIGKAGSSFVAPVQLNDSDNGA